MTGIVVLDALALLGSLIALFVAARRAGRVFTRGVALLLGVLLGLTVFHDLSNVLEWSAMTKVLDPLKDFAESLQPVFWIFFLYAYLQGVIETDLRESEQRFRVIVENAPDGIAICERGDPHLGGRALKERRLVFCNQRFLEMTGRPREELEAAPSLNQFAESHDSPEAEDAAVARFLRGESSSGLASWQRPDGTENYHEWTSVPLTLGGRLHTLDIDRDVTERVLAQRRSTAFAALGHQLGACDDAKEAARVIVDTADDLIGWDASLLTLYSPENDWQRHLLAMDLVGSERREVSDSLLDGPPSIEMRRIMAGEGRLILHERPEHVPGFTPFGNGNPSLSLLCVPLRHQGQPLGVLSIQSYTRNAYTEEDLATLQALAGHCGGALVRLRAEEDRRRAMDRLDLLHRLDRAVLAAGSVETMASGVAEHLRQLVPCDGSSIALFDRSHHVVRVLAADQQGSLRLPAGETLPLAATGPVWETLVEGRPLVAEDLATVPLTPALSKVKELGARSLILAPLRPEGALAGCVVLAATEPNAFRKEHADIACEVADTMSLALVQADLHQRLRDYAAQLEERVAQRTAALDTEVDRVEKLNASLLNILEDLESANNRLETADRRLRESNSELEAYAYSVSHDLRAPLRALDGFARALLEDCGDTLTPVAADYAHRMVAAAEQMQALIEDLLAYSRLSLAEMRVTGVPLERAVKDAQKQVSAVLAEKNGTVEVDRPLPAVVAHPSTLVQVLANLLGNGAKFVTPDTAPALRIRAECKGDVVRTWVEDNGLGIPAEEHQRIFEVFQRLHGEEAYPGTGIGLALVRKGVERMNGCCGVESEPGVGSRFWFELPAAERPNSDRPTAD